MFDVCRSCAVVVANDDTSHIFDPDDLHVIEATMEAVGMVAVGAPVDGYIRCYLCGWDHMGGYELEEL